MALLCFSLSRMACKKLISDAGRRTLSSVTSLDLGGIFPPIPTPFDDQEEIDYDALESNVTKWNKIPFQGLAVHGSNGEYTYLTSEEKIDMVRKVREWTPKTKLIIAGSGCESTRDTIQTSQAMAQAGADALLVVTPSYYKAGMTNEVLVNHFTKVADASPVPIILYSVPAFTTIDLSVEAVVRLAKHPNIIAVKDSGGNVAKIALMVHRTKNEDFQVLAGSASYILQSAVVGAVGSVCALANILGDEICRLHQLHREGDMDACCLLQQRLISPNAAVTNKFGVPGLKFAMEAFGFYGGKPRSPLLQLSEEKQQELLNDFRESGFPN